MKAQLAKNLAIAKFLYPQITTGIWSYQYTFLFQVGINTKQYKRPFNNCIKLTH